MMQILIFVLIVCFILGVLKAIWDAIGDIILGLIGIAAIVAAVIFLGPPVLSLLGTLIGLLPVVLPWVVIIFIGLFILGLLIQIVNKIRYGAQMKTLNQRGMDTFSGPIENWNELRKIHQVDFTTSGHLISVAFLKKLTVKLSSVTNLPRSQLISYCQQCAPQFQTVFITPLINYLWAQQLLLPLSLGSGETSYLTQPFVDRCEKLFLSEGAATKKEFAEICASSPATGELRKDSGALAGAILERMLNAGTVEKVHLEELGNDLYVSKKRSIPMKMVCREISLD